MERLFRYLRADEIECRVSQVAKDESWLTLLLYKDARCDMNILDETVGPFNWKREHSRDNANCTVSLWDESKGIWVSKEDTGTESNTEAAKGLASDSFKRACFNWGIGRELYTAPRIYVRSKDGTKKDRYAVSSIETQDGAIVRLSIVNEKSGAVVFSYQAKSAEKAPQEYGMDYGLYLAKKRLSDAVRGACSRYGRDFDEYVKSVKARPDYDEKDADAIVRIAEEVEQS